MVTVTFSEANVIDFITIDDKFHLSEFINLKKFRVSDTDISYRQISYLDEGGLLGKDEREQGKGWRLFSMKEVVYLLLILELKKYGFTQDQLKELCSEILINKTTHKPGKTFFDVAIGLCFSHQEIGVVAERDERFIFFDPANYALFQKGILWVENDQSSHVYIQLNNLVNKALAMMGKKPFEVKFSLAHSYIEQIVKGDTTCLTPKEQKVIDALRHQDYQSIEVRKKDGELHTMKIETFEEYMKDQTQITNLIRTKNYADIHLVKRDGKVVHVESKDTVKL